MSAVPKPNRIDLFQEITPNDGLDFDKTEESVSSVLRTATFVSSQGRAYRLFPEEAETKLGESFSLASKKEKKFPETESKPDVLRLFNSENRDVPRDSKPLDDLLSENSSVDEKIQIPPLRQPRMPLKIEETFKRLRGVEGTIGRNQKPLSVQMFDNISEKISHKTNPTAKNRITGQTEPVTKHSPKKETPRKNEETLLQLFLPKQKTLNLHSVQKTPTEKPFLDPSDLTVLPPKFLSELQDSVEIFEIKTEQEENISTKTTEKTSVVLSDPIPEKSGQDETASGNRVQMFYLDFPHAIRRKIKTRVFKKEKQSKKRRNPSDRPCLILNTQTESPNDELMSNEIETKGFKMEPEVFVLPTPLKKIEPDLQVSEIGVDAKQDETMEDENLVHSVLCSVSRKLENEETAPIDWQPCWPEHVHTLGHKAAGQIRILCDHLSDCIRRGIKAISFNSFYPGEGCTTSLICIARELASRNNHVLIIDAQANHPELTTMLGDLIESPEYGIMHLENRLEFLPWSENPIETEINGQIVTQPLATLAAELHDEYDLVLIDNGPLTEGKFEDRIDFWNKISSDGVLLVVNRKNAEKFRLEAVINRLKKHGIKLIGLTENYV